MNTDSRLVMLIEKEIERQLFEHFFSDAIQCHALEVEELQEMIFNEIPYCIQSSIYEMIEVFFESKEPIKK